jgi:hypothetical protein
MDNIVMKEITSGEAKNYRKFNNIDLYSMHLVTAFSKHKDPNDDPKWDYITYYGDIRVGSFNNDGELIHPHYIYILTNPSVPGIIKIGHTTRNVYERLKEINSAPGVIIPWDIRWSYKCPNGRMLEEEIHSYLQELGLRPNKRREGFTIDVNEAIKIIEDLGSKYHNN